MTSVLIIEEQAAMLHLHICKCKNYLQESGMFEYMVEKYIGLIFFSCTQEVIFGYEI